MKWAIWLLLASVGCAAAAPSGTPSKTPIRSRAPYEYESPGGAIHSLDIRVDPAPAREILNFLSHPRYEPSEAKLLQDLPAVRLAIQDSGQLAEGFERDLAAAFEEKSRTVVFDFRRVREERTRWEVLLYATTERGREIARMASDRARALLPFDRPVSARLQVMLSFGLAGLADHLVVTGSDGRGALVVDLERLLGDSEREPIDNQLSRLARLIAGQAFRQAWSVYREGSASWKTRDPALGQLEPLLRVVAEAGPVAFFHVDESFFPLSVWLKEAMKRSLGELNRTAERMAEGDLEARATLVTEVGRSEFARRLAGPAGAFLADGIIQASGIEELRKALQEGPKAFFQAYDQAAQARSELIPLSHVIRERLAAFAPTSPAP